MQPVRRSVSRSLSSMLFPQPTSVAGKELPMRFSMRFLLAALMVALALGNYSLGQSINRQIGTQYTATADPLVPRPTTQPCTVQLFTGYTFAFFSESNQT